MIRKTLVLVTCLLIGICTVGYVQNKVAQDVFSILLTPKQQRQSGLHKLTPAERNNLSNSIMEFFRTIMKSKEIGDSAVEFLKNDGWEEVKVVGTRRLKLDQWSNPEEYLIVEESV